MLVAFALQGIYPFGDKQIMIVDSWNQYFPFLQELHRKLTTGESLFYSWNMGMGVNFYMVMATYAMSPINLLCILFPREFLREFMMLETVFKIALAGGFFAYYIKKQFDRDDGSTLIFGLLYAFCGYAMGYYWNIMWLDAVALLPLVILGLNALIATGRYVLYTLALALTLICNYYIGYLVCEFVFFYYFVLYFTQSNAFNLLHFIKKTALVAASSVLAVGLSAVVLYPTYKALHLTYAADSIFPKVFKFYYSAFEIFNNMLSFSTPTIRDGLPNIACGIVTICLVIFYGLSKDIPLRSKLLNGALLTFLFLSFNINTLNYIWHGLHFPNEVPYRFAFVFSFVVLTLAYEGYLKLEGLSNKTLLIGAAGFLIYLAVSGIFYGSLGKPYIFILSGIFVLSYTGFLLAYRRHVITQRAWTFALCILVFIEVVIAVGVGTSTAGISERTPYPAKEVSIQKALTGLRLKDPDFYRVENARWYSVNDPSLYSYKGVSFFSSTVNAAVSKYLERLGIAALPESNRYLYASSTPLMNGLLSIKYLWNRLASKPVDNAGYNWMDAYDDISLYSVKYPLPLGFMVKDSLFDLNNNLKNPFDVQEAFILSATGLNAKVYSPILPTKLDFTNMEQTLLEGIRYGYKSQDPNIAGNGAIQYITPQLGQLYLYFYSSKIYEIKIMVGTTVTKYQTRRGHIIDLGILDKGTPIQISFDTLPAKEVALYMELVSFNKEAYVPVYEALSKEVLKITKYGPNSIKGTVDVENAATLYTSIPYDLGWSAKVDGKPAKIAPLMDAMVTLPLTPGKHAIELKFIPDGFGVGLWVSVGSVGVLTLGIGFAAWRKRVFALREAHESAESSFQHKDPLNSP